MSKTSVFSLSGVHSNHLPIRVVDWIRSGHHIGLARLWMQGPTRGINNNKASRTHTLCWGGARYYENGGSLKLCGPVLKDCFGGSVSAIQLLLQHRPVKQLFPHWQLITEDLSDLLI